MGVAKNFVFSFYPFFSLLNMMTEVGVGSLPFQKAKFYELLNKIFEKMCNFNKVK